MTSSWLQLQKKGVSFTWDSWNFLFKTGLFTKNTLHTRVASTQDLPCHITQVLRLMWCEYCQVCWGGISQYRKMAFWFCYKEGTSEQPDVEELPFVFVSWHDSMHKLPNPKAATFLGGHIDHEKSWRHLFTQNAPPTIHMPPANIPIFRIFFPTFAEPFKHTCQVWPAMKLRDVSLRYTLRTATTFLSFLL